MEGLGKKLQEIEKEKIRAYQKIRKMTLIEQKQEMA